MKKSEALKMAMVAVLAYGDMDYDETIEVLEVLIEERNSAERLEKWEEAKKNGESV